jgi:hypothetical protein
VCLKISLRQVAIIPERKKIKTLMEREREREREREKKKEKSDNVWK